MRLLFAEQGGLKSIPLSQLPEAAWTTITGGSSSQSTVNALELYETIPWLHRGVNARVNALAGMPLALHETDEDGDELERSEWPIDMNIKALVAALYKDYIIFARAYTFINQNLQHGIVRSDGKPVEIRRWQPDTVRPIEDNENGITGWKRTLKGQTKDYGKEFIAHWYKPPVRSETGHDVSDVMVALAAAGVIRSSDLYAASHFEHGGVNTTLIWDEASGGQMQETDKKRLEGWFERAVMGVRNAFKYRVVSGKFGHLTLGYPMKDTIVPELTNSKREDIATALGVPQSIMFSNAANFATAYQDDLHFYDKTIIPDGEALEEVLNDGIFHPLGYHLRFHPERMELYQRIETDKADSLRALVDGKIWTKREARQATNMPDLPADDDPQYDEFAEKPEPEAQPIPPQFQQGNGTIDEAEMDDEFEQEMKRWQAVALTRFKENKFAKALEFKSDVIPATLQSAVKGALEAVKHTDEIRAVFADMAVWKAYP